MVFVRFARAFIFILCFGGFMLQCWELFVKFDTGATTTISSNIPLENGPITWPRLSICLNPPTTLSRLSKLGLSSLSWNNKQLGLLYKGPISWPITSENNSDLFDRSMFSFEEVFEKIALSNGELTVDDRQLYKPVNTRDTGKCFTFLLDTIASQTVVVHLKNVFKNNKGRFKIFLHDHGMELLLINQVWGSEKKFVHDVELGTHSHISMKKHNMKRISKFDSTGSGCRAEWGSLDFYECIDKFMEVVREPFDCYTVFDVSLNQSDLATKKPMCTSFNKTKSLINRQSGSLWIKEYSKTCPKNCNQIYYTASTTDIQKFESNETVLYLTFETFDTSMEEEVLVHDGIAMISAVGGSLGLFLGFSFLEIAFKLINVLHNYLETK